MKIKRMDGQIQDKTDEEIIKILKNGNKFYLFTEFGEALVSVTLPKKPTLSDKIVGWKCQVDDIQKAVKNIKGRIEDIVVLNDDMGRMKILAQRIINEVMGENIVDKEERK